MNALKRLRRGLAPQEPVGERDWYRSASRDELLDEVDSHVRWVRETLGEHDPDAEQITHARRRLSDAEALLAELEARQDACNGSEP